MDSPNSALSQPAPRRAVLLVGGLIGLAVLLMNVRSLLFPMLFFDDFAILNQSWTWQRTLDNLWITHNEHAMPLGRLCAFVVIQLAPATCLPLACILLGFVSLLLGMLLLYTFVRRELGQPFYGLVAVTLFAVTSIYGSCVYWFACSFWMLGLDTILLALLAAQSWRQSGRGLSLDLCALACLLAPGWYAGAILAGPLCCLYLLPPRKAPSPGSPGESGGRFDRVSITPLLGTFLFLAISLPRTATMIMHLPHYDGQTVLQAFHPDVGLLNTGRSMIDNLLIGQLGFYVMDYPLPVWLSLPILAVVAVAVGWWLGQAPEPRLIVLGLAFILFGYWLIFSARANWGYGNSLTTGVSASRYHLLPQLGLALSVCGGLPGRDGRWFHLAEAGRLRRGPFRALLILVAVCFVIQVPRGLVCGINYDPKQGETFRTLEIVEARCRQHHISGDAARGALPPLAMPDDPENGWKLLRGSDDPRPMEPDEVRRLLEGGN